jgi:hypothetical protein
MTPTEAREVIQNYGAVLEERTALGTIRDINSLPYSKDRIKEALLYALRVTLDSSMRERLRSAYILLADFQQLSNEQITSLRNWNKTTTMGRKSAITLDELREEARELAQEGEQAIIIQDKCAAEMESLLLELKSAGF